jgi:uncharacterized protein with FMN-binding domain
MKRRRSNTLVALSSAAVMTVYAAGFMRTRAAAERLEHSSRTRPPVIPAPAPEAAPPLAAATATVEPAAAPAAAAPKAAPAVREKRAAKAPVETVAKSEAAEKRDGQLIAVATRTTEPEKLNEPAPAKIEPATAAAVTPDLAPAPMVPAAPPMSPSAEVLLGGTELHDGTFLGWGTSRHGDIQASVTLLSGRITAVSIAQCRTRYSCDVIAHLPAKVLKDQTPEKINNVSGATQSVDAFYYAVVDAMNKAKAK